jgi:alkylation response protein AidB-like acyl-CoA dehydrogenase
MQPRSSSSSTAWPVHLAGDGYASARATEQALGCPFDAGSAISFEAVVRADEEESSPDWAFATLGELGVYPSLVPTAEGGRLDSFDDLLMLTRLLARRDLVLTVGIGSTFLAATPIWLWGDAGQRARAAEIVTGGGFATLGVTEESAGSDLVATRTRATRVDSGFRLDGEKWLVGNARRADFYVVLARAEPSFGLFLVDRDRIESGTVQKLPKVRTLGLRGHDLSGMAFRGCLLPAEAAVGRVGRGLEMVSATLQFTRTLVAGMCLGAADTALRIALRWARTRRLYGAPIVDLPPVRRLLAGAFADLLICECTAIPAARGLNVAPHRMSLWSPVVKYLVPSLCEQVVRDSAEVLAARNYLREGLASGVFQKLASDVAMATVFEGTQLVQLETVRAQLAHGMRRRYALSDEAVARAELFTPGAAVAPWDPQNRRPSLSHGRDDEIVDGLEDVVEELHESPAQEAPHLALLAAHALEVRDETRRDLASLAAGDFDRSTKGYDLARAHCLVHAAACCLEMWLENRERYGGDFADGHWVVLCLTRLLQKLGRPCARPATVAEERCARWLSALEEQNQLFSLLPFPLAPTNPAPTGGDL